MKRRFLIIGGVAALAGCVSGQTTAPAGQGATPQQRIVSAAGINYANAKTLAGRKGFDDTRDLGFSVSAAARGGALNVAGGVVSFFAAEPVDRSLMTLMIAETNGDQPTPEQKANIHQSISAVTGMSSKDIGVSWGAQGTANGKRVHLVSFGVRGKSIRTEELIDIHKRIEERHRGLISVYVPPLRYPEGWQDPYLLRSGRKLAL